MSKWDNPIDARLADIFDALDEAQIREQRNTRFILRVMAKQHAEVMAAVSADGGQAPKGVLSFGKPKPKSA